MLKVNIASHQSPSFLCVKASLVKAKKGDHPLHTTIDATTIITRAEVVRRAACSKRAATPITRGEASTEVTHPMSTGKSLHAKVGREAGAARTAVSTIDSSQQVRASTEQLGHQRMTAAEA